MPLDGRLKRKKVKIANFMFVMVAMIFFLKGEIAILKKGKLPF